jgi:hypothetical protein
MLRTWLPRLMAVLVTLLVVGGLLSMLSGGTPHTAAGTPADTTSAGELSPLPDEIAGQHRQGVSHPSGTPQPSSSVATAGAVGGVGGNANTFQTLKARTQRVLATAGTAAALTELDTAIQTDPANLGVCHAVAHDLGHAALARAQGDAAAVLNARNDVCGGGFLHGVVEAKLGSSGAIEEDILQVCAPNQDGSCLHGVGHGVTFAANGDVDKAMDMCDLVAHLEQGGRCAEGMMMQLWLSDSLAGHVGAKGKTTADALVTCPRVREPYGSACWFYAPTLILDRADAASWGRAANWCADTVPGDSDARWLCAMGTGSRAVKYNTGDIPRAGGYCQLFIEELVDACLRGMGSYWAVHWMGERRRADVCDQLVDEALASRCRYAIDGSA